MPSEPAPQEAAVLDCIKRNPFASQQEIADLLGLARSTVAAHVVSLMKKGHVLGRGYVLPSRRHVACIGGAIMDRKFRARGQLSFEADNAVQSSRSAGGIARNVVETLALLGDSTSFVTVLGDDDTGREMRNTLRDRGVDVSQIFTGAERPTAEYSVVLDNRGDVVMGLSEMDVFELFTADRLDRIWSHLAGADWIFADTNLPAETLARLIARARTGRFRLAIAGASDRKVLTLPADLTGVDLLFVSPEAAAALLARAGVADDGDGLAAQLLQLGVRHAVICTAHLVSHAGPDGAATLPQVPAALLDATGATDGLIGGTLHRLLDGDSVAAALRYGSLVAALTLESSGTVRPDLSDDFVRSCLSRLPPDPVAAARPLAPAQKEFDT